MYADDTSLLLSGKNLNDLICFLNNELYLLSIWVKSNKLSLYTQNDVYYKVLCHRTRIKGNNSFIKLNDCVLNIVNCIKHSQQY